MNVLLTGPTGYIGRRLKERRLEEKDVHLRLFVKDIRRVSEETRQNVEIFEGDLFNEEDLRRAVTGIDVAYYPIRFFWAGTEFDEIQKIFARNFRDACILHAGVKKIIYLGVLGSHNTEDNLLKNVIETGEVLSALPDKIRTISLRAGFVLGSGSSLFEVLRNLAQKVPVIFTPRWMEAKLVPLGIADTLEYLTQARNLEGKDNLIIDLGAEMLSFRDMLKETLQVIGRKRVFIPLPFTGCTPHAAAMSQPKALIVPHDGYPYSGPVAGCAYRLLRDSAATIRHVVLLGPSHRVPMRGLAVPTVDSFSTPLGEVPLDAPGRQHLREFGLVGLSDAPHAAEHSVEVQLPFLQVALGRFDILPIALGLSPPEQVARALEAAWGGADTLVVVSSDMSHYHTSDEARVLDAESTRP